ncbi:phosphate uptake regulator [Caldisphaera lagunensis DSM 15908]|uniref:Phosphate uptake regulator n=1 Tax=Caldisphaera lagunensis (strain DSM 15908 / JCM 11604 / ANMR 0165 / IC-154) TaxID=1056495 RepID=L0ABI0_CALLD|nr:phosphate uptake regulator PhoU [Caldisphaera lagunensis]AFZ71253.1 phosphate uptake regulator [Caldisphaera lagunensis DSM 15908]
MIRKNIKQTKLLRKVQITGGSTYIVSIPKEWAKELGIDKGLEIVMELGRDNSLRLYSPKREIKPVIMEKEIYVNQDLIDSAIVMEIISAYLAGYNSIKLVFSPLMLSRMDQIINEVRNKVVGLDVLEEGENNVTLRVVVDLSSIPEKLAMDNMQKTFKSMLEDFIEGIKNKDKEIFYSIIKRDDVMDKLYLYIYKQINLALQGQIKLEDIGINNSIEAINVYSTIKSIERIADHVVFMSSWIIDTLGEIEITEQLNKLINDVFNEVITVVNNIGKEININELIKSYSNLHELIIKELELIKSLKGSKQFFEIYPILDGLRRAMAYSLDIIEAQVGLSVIREIDEKRKT